jgi:uncharacterized protein
MTIQEANSNPWTRITKDSLPDTLARNGYVVLVLARRGYKGSEGAASTYTQNQASRGYSGRRAVDVMRGAEEEVGDVIAALEYLLTLPYVDKDRVGVGGVSLGALVSVMAAARDPRFKALISMAGAAVGRAVRAAWMRPGGRSRASGRMRRVASRYPC